MKIHKKVPTAWQEPMHEEGRPDAGQGAEEERNYFHQPQPEPGPEPMNEEAQEAMAREDVGSRPTLEQTEEAYVRNRNNRIVYIVCTMLQLGDPEEIVRSVAELVYLKWQGKEFQEPLPKNREEPDTDEEAAARAEAIELRNKAIEAEERADKIRRDAHWFPPKDEDERDCADENKLRLYGDIVNKVTSTANLHCKGKKKQKFEKLVVVTLRPMELARVKDKEVQTSLQHTVLPKMRGQTQQVKFFAHMCRTMEANTPSYRSFWRYYYNKKQEVKYMIEHIYNFPYNRVLYNATEIQPMWELGYF